VTLRVYKGKVLRLTGGAKLKKGKGVATLKGIGTLKAGRYRLLVTVGLPGARASRDERGIRFKR
jgi:hypothetical protein